MTPIQQKIIKALVALRFIARKSIERKRNLEKRSAEYPTMISLKEEILDERFRQIDIGKRVYEICQLIEENNVPREAVFDAINTNRADRDSPITREYGTQAIYLISALRLENSATKDEGILYKPLNWCCTMFMMNARMVNEGLDKAMHNKANELFGGAFGEYQERSLTSRLAGVHA